MVKFFFHTLAAILETIAAMSKVHVASTFFLQSDPKGTFLPNVMLVSPLERFCQKITLNCSTTSSNAHLFCVYLHVYSLREANVSIVLVQITANSNILPGIITATGISFIVPLTI